MSYLAEQMALFGIVVGFALLLAGLGFGIMTLGGALRGVDRATKPAASAAPTHGVGPVAPTV